MATLLDQVYYTNFISRVTGRAGFGVYRKSAAEERAGGRSSGVSKEELEALPAVLRYQFPHEADGPLSDNLAIYGFTRIGRGKRSLLYRIAPAKFPDPSGRRTYWAHGYLLDPFQLNKAALLYAIEANFAHFDQLQAAGSEDHPLPAVALEDLKVAATPTAHQAPRNPQSGKGKWVAFGTEEEIRSWMWQALSAYKLIERREVTFITHVPDWRLLSKDYKDYELIGCQFRKIPPDFVRETGGWEPVLLGNLSQGPLPELDAAALKPLFNVLAGEGEDRDAFTAALKHLSKLNQAAIHQRVADGLTDAAKGGALPTIAPFFRRNFISFAVLKGAEDAHRQVWSGVGAKCWTAWAMGELRSPDPDPIPALLADFEQFQPKFRPAVTEILRDMSRRAESGTIARTSRFWSLFFELYRRAESSNPDFPVTWEPALFIDDLPELETGFVSTIPVSAARGLFAVVFARSDHDLFRLLCDGLKPETIAASLGVDDAPQLASFLQEYLLRGNDFVASFAQLTTLRGWTKLPRLRQAIDLALTAVATDYPDVLQDRMLWDSTRHLGHQWGMIPAVRNAFFEFVDPVYREKLGLASPSKIRRAVYELQQRWWEHLEPQKTEVTAACPHLLAGLILERLAQQVESGRKVKNPFGEYSALIDSALDGIPGDHERYRFLVALWSCFLTWFERQRPDEGELLHASRRLEKATDAKFQSGFEQAIKDAFEDWHPSDSTTESQARRFFQGRLKTKHAESQPAPPKQPARPADPWQQTSTLRHESPPTYYAEPPSPSKVSRDSSFPSPPPQEERAAQPKPHAGRTSAGVGVQSGGLMDAAAGRSHENVATPESSRREISVPETQHPQPTGSPVWQTPGTPQPRPDSFKSEITEPVEQRSQRQGKVTERKRRAAGPRNAHAPSGQSKPKRGVPLWLNGLALLAVAAAYWVYDSGGPQQPAQASPKAETNHAGQPGKPNQQGKTDESANRGPFKRLFARLSGGEDSHTPLTPKTLEKQIEGQLEHAEAKKQGEWLELFRPHLPENLRNKRGKPDLAAISVAVIEFAKSEQFPLLDSGRDLPDNYVESVIVPTLKLKDQIRRLEQEKTTLENTKSELETARNTAAKDRDDAREEVGAAKAEAAALLKAKNDAEAKVTALSSAAKPTNTDFSAVVEEAKPLLEKLGYGNGDVELFLAEWVTGRAPEAGLKSEEIPRVISALQSLDAVANAAVLNQRKAKIRAWFIQEVENAEFLKKVADADCFDKTKPAFATMKKAFETIGYYPSEVHIPTDGDVMLLKQVAKDFRRDFHLGGSEYGDSKPIDAELQICLGRLIFSGWQPPLARKPLTVVRFIAQSKLIEDGKYKGKPDGIEGKDTRSALAAFINGNKHKDLGILKPEDYLRLQQD